jgi:membrane protein CcdC involved in cytochrome C biogenesis
MIACELLLPLIYVKSCSCIFDHQCIHLSQHVLFTCNRLQVVFSLLLLQTFASAIERRVFRGRSAAFAINLILAALALHAPGYYLKVWTIYMHACVHITNAAHYHI